MPEKKIGQADFEKKIGEAKNSVVETAEIVGEKSKKVIGKIGARWGEASTEEKIYMVLGIILLLIGIIALRGLILPVICIIIGILLVTGFFNSSKK